MIPILLALSALAQSPDVLLTFRVRTGETSGESEQVREIPINLSQLVQLGVQVGGTRQTVIIGNGIVTPLAERPTLYLAPVQGRHVVMVLDGATRNNYIGPGHIAAPPGADETWMVKMESLLAVTRPLDYEDAARAFALRATGQPIPDAWQPRVTEPPVEPVRPTFFITQTAAKDPARFVNQDLYAISVWVADESKQLTINLTRAHAESLMTKLAAGEHSSKALAGLRNGVQWVDPRPIPVEGMP